MDVRGPAESHDANNQMSRVRLEPVRYESAETVSNTKSHLFTPHSEAPEIVGLTQQLKAMPEVREELVTEMIAKLREGHFSTRKSAERTAAAILGTLSKE